RPSEAAATGQPARGRPVRGTRAALRKETVGEREGSPACGPAAPPRRIRPARSPPDLPQGSAASRVHRPRPEGSRERRGSAWRIPYCKQGASRSPPGLGDEVGQLLTEHVNVLAYHLPLLRAPPLFPLPCSGSERP